jgi:hypothetical protein
MVAETMAASPADTSDRAVAVAATQQHLFERVQTLRALVIQGLVGEGEPEIFAQLGTRILDTLSTYEAFDKARIDGLRKRFARVPAIADSGQRLTLAAQALDGTNLMMVETLNTAAPGSVPASVPDRRQRPAFIALALFGLLLVAVAVLYKPLYMEGVIFKHHGERIAALSTIEDALTRYHADNGAYPLSADNGAGWSGVGWNGEGDTWLPGLVPDYLAAVPVDPRHDVNPYRQYIYRSNGAGYKLLSLVPEDCVYATEMNPALSDPKRNVYEQCYAYGVWTPDAVTW